MSIAYLGIIVFLFMLAIVDLTVGVSNDAVNFLSGAVGSKAASLKRIITIAAIGILLGTATSSGMMDIARHGIFQPEYFFFSEVMCIFLAVVVSDVILLDIFNNLGLPTSTTVSMVFELLGASFVVSLIKLGGNCEGYSLMDLINTEKALTVIIGIFLSVAIAFFFGTLVQWLARLLFTYNYNKGLGKKIGIFGGIAATSIFYFMLIKGMKGAPFMSYKVMEDMTLGTWVNENVGLIVLVALVFFTILMQILYWFKVNVFKVVVLMGTFALAMAFAGNDLVNFIGVTMAGFDSFLHFSEAGFPDPSTFSVAFLRESAKTPFYFLIGAGVIMVIALVTSKKARKVLATSINLSAQDGGDELFGTSPAARSVVRAVSGAADAVIRIVPRSVRRWCDSRFVVDKEAAKTDDGTAFDLVRAAVNLVLSGLLIALGTSLGLPLSTTYVAFMVAMGSALADRAWGRESAVYRVTGVISVIGGWLITAGAAFTLASIVVLINYYGGLIGMGCVIVLAAFILIHSHLKYNKEHKEDAATDQMTIIMTSEDKNEVFEQLCSHTAATLSHTLDFAANTYRDMFQAFTEERLKVLRRSLIRIVNEKSEMKKMRRLETKGLQRIDKGIAFEKNAFYHLSTNSCQQILNTLNRICDPMKEHTDNNFAPLSNAYIEEFSPYCRQVYLVFENISQMISTGDFSRAEDVSQEAKALKKKLSDLRKMQTSRLADEGENLKTAFVYLNLIQESHELLSQVRNVLRGCEKFFSNEYKNISQVDA